MAKRKAKDRDAEPSFEEALAQIQGIVQDLEDGSLGLEESLTRFESGIRLIRQCHQTLEQAEQRIRVLTDVDAEGNPVLTDFDATATADEKRPAAGRRKRKTADADDKPDGSSLF